MNRYTAFFLFISFSCALYAQEGEPADTIDRGSVNLNADYRLNELLSRYKEVNEGKQIQGYRVQLYSGDRKGAFDLKANFIKQFPELPCNVVYESPDFKVQIGNYRTQMEAECGLHEIRPVFKAAFVVPALIDLPELPIYKESN